MIILILFLSFQVAALEISPEFRLSIGAKICTQQACQSSSLSDGVYRLEMNGSCGNQTGEMRLSYTINSVLVDFYVSFFQAQIDGKAYNEFYLEVSNASDSASKSGALTVVEDVSSFEPFIFQGVAFSKDGMTVWPEVKLRSAASINP